MPISSDRSGYVNKDELRAYIISQLENSTLKGNIPSDGSDFGINEGTVDEWAELLFQLAGKESSYNRFESGDPNVSYIPGGSHGLFMLSERDANTYQKFLPENLWGKGSGKNERGQNIRLYTQDQLQDPTLSTDVAIKIFEHWVGKRGAINRNPEGQKGVSSYYGPIDKGWRPTFEYIKPQVKRSPSLKIVRRPNASIVESGEDRREFVGSLDKDLPTYAEGFSEE